MVKKPSSELRSLEQLRLHYEIEIKLATRLRHANKSERPKLYPSVYNELLRQVPDHPQLTRKANFDSRIKVVNRQVKFLSKFLSPQSVFVEIGAGDCALSIAVANFVKKVYAVDVSAEVTKNLVCPSNFELILSDGCTIPVPEGAVNVIFSNQLMEHLHPDDAFDQLRHIYKALAPGGVYICFTPHRFSGPHDISQYFDLVASGFHLKEYTNAELMDLLRGAGFSKVSFLLGGKGRFFSAPTYPVLWIESLLSRTKRAQRRWISNLILARLVLGIRSVAIK